METPEPPTGDAPFDRVRANAGRTKLGEREDAVLAPRPGDDRRLDVGGNYVQSDASATDESHVIALDEQQRAKPRGVMSRIARNSRWIGTRPIIAPYLPQLTFVRRIVTKTAQLRRA